MAEKVRMGRPTTNPRKNRLSIRLSDKEMKMLENYSKENNITKTETIARAIKNL